MASREERRWVTVLFADLSEFTTLSERMDAEDVKALAHRCAERMSEQVRRFGGTVLNVVGDQIVTVFGAPLAHEDDAERAVRAGLAIRDCELSEDPTRPIRVHIGINTGEVMAGMIGPQERCDYTVIGDTVNTAARLMSAAPPGSILVGEETRRATRRSVAYRELPPLTVKGKEHPVPVAEALALLEATEARPPGTTSLIGRDEELSVLSGTWLKVVREARPHLISVLGDPGLGKSRLVAEFERRVLSDGSAAVIHGRCLPHGEALGYWALGAALREAAGITAEHDGQAARRRLSELVHDVARAQTTEWSPAEVTNHLALLCGFDPGADHSAGSADQRTLHVSVRRFFEAFAHRKPLCVIFEDIHWADEALLDLIELVASRAKDVPLLLITQARPGLLEKRVNWGGGVRAFTSLALAPLDEGASTELIRSLCRERGLPTNAIDQIGRNAAGNPLFAEELVAMIAERGVSGGVPSAIKALIAARLDALPAPERGALQLAAVFGKSFWLGGLRALDFPGDAAKHLEALEQKDLVRAQPRSQFRGDQEFIFKHDLIRDAAYETLPRTERRKRHGQIADWIERVAGDQLENYFDQLAHHSLSAGQEERSMNCLSLAARRANRVAAHREEAALLAQAMTIATRLQQHDLVTEFHARRGFAFMGVALWEEARPELEAALARLKSDDIETRGKVLVELASICFWEFDSAGARHFATEGLRLADDNHRDDIAAGALAWHAAAEQSDGNIERAQNLYRSAIARDGGREIAPYALFPLNLYLSGRINEAIEIASQAVEKFRAHNKTSYTMFGIPHLGLALAGAGRYAEAAQVFEDGCKFGKEYGIWRFLARSLSMSAGFHLDVFDYAGNEARAEEGRELGRSGGFQPSVVSSGIDLLLNFIRRGEVSRAETLFTETTALAAQIGGWHDWLWDLRLAQARAELALACGDSAAAVQLAKASVLKSHAKQRSKYEVAALGTSASALHALGRTREAIADLNRALALARPVGDPAMFLRPACALLGLDGSDALLAETRTVAQKILAALPDELMRRRFIGAEPLRVLGILATV